MTHFISFLFQTPLSLIDPLGKPFLSLSLLSSVLKTVVILFIIFQEM
jgi:hypothetical protein